VAEEILLGTPTSAAADSLAQARSLAKRIASDLSVVPRADGADAVRLILEAEGRARELLVARRAVLEEVARRLAERERVSAGELLRIVHGREEDAK
jgi:ATP-dependent Zn protease